MLASSVALKRSETETPSNVSTEESSVYEHLRMTCAEQRLGCLDLRPKFETVLYCMNKYSYSVLKIEPCAENHIRYL